MTATARITATLALQRPKQPWRGVCPHCQRETTVHDFIAPDSHWIETHHCPVHGDVAPLHGNIVNGDRL